MTQNRYACSRCRATINPSDVSHQLADEHVKRGYCPQCEKVVLVIVTMQEKEAS